MNTNPIDFTDKGQTYHSYLLRLWRVKTTDGCVWQASLENIATRKVQGFPTLESLFTFLKTETESSQNSL